MNELNVKVGDKVLFTSVFQGKTAEKITKVTRITPTGRIRVEIAPEIMFTKCGHEMGRQHGLYTARCISALTPEKEKEIREREILNTCKRAFDLCKDKLTVKQATDILKILGCLTV